MTVPRTEFVFLPVKSSFSPEDSSNDESQAFFEMLATLKAQTKCVIWSRSIDKPDIIGIGIGMCLVEDVIMSDTSGQI